MFLQVWVTCTSVEQEQKLLVNNKYFVLLFANNSARIGLGHSKGAVYLLGLLSFVFSF
jgi:hypothetical protein